MGVARFYVSGEMLRQILCLPADTQILAAADSPESNGRGDVELTVSHPDLPDADGPTPPLIEPHYGKEYQAVAVFKGWNREPERKAGA